MPGGQFNFLESIVICPATGEHMERTPRKRKMFLENEDNSDGYILATEFQKNSLKFNFSIEISSKNSKFSH